MHSHRYLSRPIFDAWFSRRFPRQAYLCAGRSLISVSRLTPSSLPLGDWAHELKHDGYRLQIHVRDGHVHDERRGLVEAISADCWRRIALKDSAIFDAEVVWLGSNGVADFEALPSRVNDGRVVRRSL